MKVNAYFKTMFKNKLAVKGFSIAILESAISAISVGALSYIGFGLWAAGLLLCYYSTNK